MPVRYGAARPVAYRCRVAVKPQEFKAISTGDGTGENSFPLKPRISMCCYCDGVNVSFKGVMGKYPSVFQASTYTETP